MTSVSRAAVTRGCRCLAGRRAGGSSRAPVPGHRAAHRTVASSSAAPAPGQGSSPSRRTGCTEPCLAELSRRGPFESTATTTEHTAYLSDVAALPAPPQLPALVRVLAAQGQTLLSPSRRAGLHPLVVPLAVSADGRQVTAVLRWPNPVDEFVLPVVTVPSPSSHGAGSRVSLVARSASEYIHRALAEEDAAAGDVAPRPVAKAVGDTPLPFAFAAGDASRAMRAAAAAAAAAGAQPRPGSRHAPLDVYLIQKCGKFPDVCARLVQGHITAGDVTAAMVTADWACTHFKGWASVRAASAETHSRLGRPDEARDNARAALAGGALWTLGWQPADAATRTLELAKLSGRSASWLRENLVDGAGPADDGSPGSKAAGSQPARTPQQVALAKAETLLDALALGEVTWADVAGDVQAAFTQAGRQDMARFLAACSAAM